MNDHWLHRGGWRFAFGTGIAGLATQEPAALTGRGWVFMATIAIAAMRLEYLR